MTSGDLLYLILSQGPHSDTLPHELRRTFFKLHDHLPELTLRCGKRVSDIPDMMELCREFIEELDPRSSARMRKPMRTVCGVCYHCHEGDGECGVDLGGAGKCDCKAEVTA